MQYVNDHRIPLEVCLSSNVQTRAVRTLRRAVRGRRLSRRQAVMLDVLLSVVANEHDVLPSLAGVGRPRVGGAR